MAEEDVFVSGATTQLKQFRRAAATSPCPSGQAHQLPQYGPVSPSMAGRMRLRLSRLSRLSHGAGSMR